MVNFYTFQKSWQRHWMHCLYNAIYNNIILKNIKYSSQTYNNVTWNIIIIVSQVANIRDAELAAVYEIQKLATDAGFIIIIRPEPAVADIPRDILCNPRCVRGREKPQKDIFVPLLPYIYPCPTVPEDHTF